MSNWWKKIFCGLNELGEACMVLDFPLGEARKAGRPLGT